MDILMRIGERPAHPDFRLSPCPSLAAVGAQLARLLDERSPDQEVCVHLDVPSALDVSIPLAFKVLLRPSVGFRSEGGRISAHVDSDLVAGRDGATP